MTIDPKPQHPSDETLAAFVDEGLDPATRTAVLSHIETCAECMAAVLAANAHRNEEQAARPVLRRWWMAVAAALLIAAVAVPWFRRREEPMARLVSLAPRSARLVEPRLSGGFAWAAYAGTDRATGGASGAAQMKLVGAAGELVERADGGGGAEWQHAAGVAMVLVQKPGEALPRLEAAARNTKDAHAWSDLAAARYAAAAQSDRASLYPMALAAVDVALGIDPQLPEALFNRALILERLGLTDQAGRAWRRYLEVDPSSPWAAEARARLGDLPASSRSSRFEHIRPMLEQAATRGDARAVAKLVEAHPDRARAYTETEYLGRWGEAEERGDEAAARSWLAVARGVAGALVQVSGESLARDAVRAIDGASAAERTAIAAAHVAYRRGRIAYSRHELEAAERDLRAAAGLFETAHDPMALAARYYAAGVRIAKNEIAAGRVELERARAEADAQPSYVSLRAHVRWELGRASMLDDDWTGAAPVLAEGAALFRAAGDRPSEAFVETMLARALTFLGRPDEAWLARTRAFAALSAEGELALLASSVAAAMHVEWLAGRRDAGLALSDVAVDVARASAKPGRLVEALATQARVLAESDPAAALLAAREAEGIARTTADPARRARLQADVDMASGAALAVTDPRRAIEHLTQAVTFLSGHDLAYALPEALLRRARCAERLGDAGAALADLDRGMSLVERRRASADRTELADVLDAEHALFTDGIRLSLDRGDVESAFLFAGRLRLDAVPVAELQRRLAGSGVAVVQMVALPEELITFAVSERRVLHGRRPRSAADVATLAEASRTEDGNASASALYDDVIRPVEAILDGARELVIVPDPRLDGAAFAALVDAGTQRLLVERIAVAIAPSAASLRPDRTPHRAPSVVAVELPAAQAAALPEVRRELAAIAAEYLRARTIAAGEATLDALREAAAGAGVLHLAGHTEALPAGGGHALLVTGAAGGVERVSAKTIRGGPPVRAGIVVLAACETLRAADGRSLGAAFTAAGAGDVIGTLAPIGDRDARLLFRALHRHLARGETPSAALRAVQREAIANDPGGRRAWRAVTLLTTRISVVGKAAPWAS